MESKSTNGNNPKPAKRSFLDRFKRNTETADESSAEPEELPEPQSKISFGQRMRSALSRTGEGLGSLFLGTKVIDEALLEELETSLIMADVGIETTTKIIAELTKQLDRKSLKDGAALKDALHEILLKKLRQKKRTKKLLKEQLLKERLLKEHLLKEHLLKGKRKKGIKITLPQNLKS